MTRPDTRLLPHGRHGKKRTRSEEDGPYSLILHRCVPLTARSRPVSTPYARLPSTDHPASVERTAFPRVIVWRGEGGGHMELNAQVHRWKEEGWQVERCDERVLEGPAYGALVVLRRTKTVDRLKEPVPRTPIASTADKRASPRTPHRSRKS